PASGKLQALLLLLASSPPPLSSPLKAQAGGELDVDGPFTFSSWFLQSRVFNTSPEGEITLLPWQLVGGFETKALLGGLHRPCLETVLLMSPIRGDPGSGGKVVGSTPKKSLRCSPDRMSNNKLFQSKTTCISGVGVPHWPRIARL